jgi:hypothetical protein
VVGTTPTSRLAADADGTLLGQPLAAARRQTTREEGSWMMDQLLRLDVAGDILKLIRIGRCLPKLHTVEGVAAPAVLGAVHGGSLEIHTIHTTIPTWEINPPPTYNSITPHYFKLPPHTAGHDGKERKSRQKAPPGQ